MSGGKPTPGVNNAEYRIALDRFELPHHRAHELFGVAKRDTMRWYRDRDPVPDNVTRLLRFLVRTGVAWRDLVGSWTDWRPHSMADDARKVGVLVRTGEISEDDLMAAVNRYLKGEPKGLIDLGGGYKVDVAAAIQAHKQAREVMADPGARTAHRRTMVLTAIIAAVPDKA